MMTRRAFTKIAMLGMGAISTAPVLANKSANKSASQGLPVSDARFDYALIDQRINADQHVVHNLTSNARQIITIEEDVSAFWQEQLQPALADHAILVTGITSGYTAFVVAELVRDYGHELVYSSFDLSKSSQTTDRLTLPAMALNTARPVYWLLGSNGINFHA